MSLYVIIMGVQGAGKGLQAQSIEQQFNIPQVSTGDLFRAMKTRSDSLARKVQAIMASGQLVDDDTTNAIVADRLAQPDASQGVILDGYPRNQSQAAFLEQHLSEMGERIHAVVLLELDLYAAFKRAFGRVTADDGSSYNVYYNSAGLETNWSIDETGSFPPRLVAQLAGSASELKRRPDDASAHAIIQRIDTYVASTQPLIRYFEARGILQRINADQPIDAVSADIVEVLRSL